MEALQTRGGFSGNQIKLIAILAMTIDHVTWLLFPGFDRTWWVFALHIIGRLTAPIMWFFIAEGFYYTRNVKKYLARLFLFAIVSHFAYDLAGGIAFVPHGIFNQTSVIWSLAWAVVLLCVYEKTALPMWAKGLLTFAICLITFPSDWSSIAAMCPFFLYQHRGDFRRQARDIVFWSFLYALVYFLFLDRLYGILQLATALSIPVLRSYNGQRGKWKGMKWLFYLYYPAHLFAIGAARLALGIGGIFP